ncbi:MAG: hypothetical protein Q8K65_07905 [Alphaproteobacteria bacterium]|nr:hypothetical protein [Alphaproteobacteria bacterium]
MLFKNKTRRMTAPVAALLFSLLLAGCGSMGQKVDNLPCPDTGLILSAASLTSFSGASTAEGEMVIEATLANYRGACRWRQEVLEFMLEVDVAARRGAAGQTLKRGEFPYFIAILDPEENVLQRQGFSTTVSFDNNGSGISTEKHVLRVPLEDRKNVRLHKVVIGFELSSEQLAYNRRHEKPAAPAPSPGKKTKAVKR